MNIETKSQNKNPFFLIVDYILAFFLALDCASVYSLLLPDLFKYMYLSFLVVAVLGKISRKKKNINIGKFIIFAAFYILLLFILYLKAFNQISLIYRFFLIVPLFILYFLFINPRTESYFSLFFKFSTIVYYLAIVSLFFWFSSSIFSFLEPSGRIPFIWGNEQLISHYWGIHFETQYSSSFFLGVYRNSGIFAEAPMYNVCLCIALTFEVFLKKNPNKYKIIILSMTILSTLTTTGQLFLFIILFIKVYTMSGKKLIYKLLKALVFPLFLLLSSFVIIIIWDQKKDTASYEIRNNDIEEAISSWEESPIFGGGYGLNVEGTSNSFFTLLADGGVMLLSLYLLGILGVQVLFYLKYKKSAYLYVSICIFIVFSITMIVYSLLILSYLALGLSVLMMKRKEYLQIYK